MAFHGNSGVLVIDRGARAATYVAIGHDSIACHLANIAFRVGRRVDWDVDNERVVGDGDAQKLVLKEYRAPWKLPAISAGRTA